MELGLYITNNNLISGYNGKNPIFDYYKLINGGRVLCRICGCVMAYKKSSYLTNVARHLKRHRKYFDEYNNKKLELKTSRMKCYYNNFNMAPPPPSYSSHATYGDGFNDDHGDIP